MSLAAYIEALITTGKMDEMEKAFQNVFYVIVRTVAWMMKTDNSHNGDGLRSFIELRLDNTFYRPKNDSKEKQGLEEYESKYDDENYGKVSPFNIPVCSYRS